MSNLIQELREKQQGARDVVLGAANLIEQISQAMREGKVMAFNSRDLELMQFLIVSLRQIGAKIEVYPDTVN